jgi:hypothetical protein
MKRLILALVATGFPLGAFAADTPAPSSPPVSITIGSRHAHVSPVRQGFTHTGGGNIDVAQPAADTLVITMTGVAVAGGHPIKASTATMSFQLDQLFEITFEKPEIKRAKLTLEGRVIGLLRSHTSGGGSAEQGAAIATVTGGSIEPLVLTVPAHCVSGGESQSVNCREGPVASSVVAGKYTLQEQWTITATHPKSLKLAKAVSAEFAPDPALDPLWISYWEPFHGATKKDFGLQITLKVVPE